MNSTPICYILHFWWRRVVVQDPNNWLFSFKLRTVLTLTKLVIPPHPQPFSNIHKRTVVLPLDAAVLPGWIPYYYYWTQLLILMIVVSICNLSSLYNTTIIVVIVSLCAVKCGTPRRIERLYILLCIIILYCQFICHPHKYKHFFPMTICDSLPDYSNEERRLVLLHIHSNPQSSHK